MTKEEFFDNLEDNLSKAEIGFKSYNKALTDVSVRVKNLKDVPVTVDRSYYKGYMSALHDVLYIIAILKGDDI